MFNIDSYILSLGAVLYFTLCLSALYTVISEKRDPVKTMSWIIVVVMLPYVGFLCYIVFGQNFRKRKIFTRKLNADMIQLHTIVSRQLYKVNSPLMTKRPEVESNRDIITLLLKNSQSPVSYNNTTKILNNGEETFPEIMQELKRARLSIHMEYYMILDDMLGNQIADILCDKAMEGVSVRVIYDDVGSWAITRKFIRKLENAGVQIIPFMPVLFPWFTSKVNYRNHRKIIVIDGQIGFTGGLNIANKYLFGSLKSGQWRDTHLKIEGKAVHTLQAIFIADWYFVSGKRLELSKYFPAAHNQGIETMQIVYSGPDTPWASIMQTFFMAITRAKRHVYISTPYFIPTESLLTALKVAALGGVDVNIMIPSCSDSRIVYWATRSYITELLEAGVSIYLYRRGFNHSKTMSVDSEVCFIGSANLDARSLEDNFEVTAVIYGKDRTLELEAKFREDMSHSTHLTLYTWLRRGKKDKTREAICRLLSPLL